MTDNPQRGGCLGALLRLFLPDSEKGAVTYPYGVRDDFLSPAELSLFHVLRQVVGAQATILTKIRLADLFFVQRPHENRAAFNRIAQRHIDFLLCQPQTMRPLLGIELDDASHAKKDTAARDAFLNRTFAAAGLPLLRIPAQRAYNTRELAEKIISFLTEPAIPPMPSPAAPSAPVASDAPPLCLKCRVPMVMRTGTKGKYAGKAFYGCPNYPRCHEVMPIDAL